PASITAINARTTDLQAFFTAGGGLLYLAGAGVPGAYASVPVPATAAPVSPPFTLTAAGVAVGLNATEGNCCATHNSFNLPPSGGALVTAETDTAGLAETLIATGGSICGGALCGGGATTQVPTLSEWAMIVMATLVLLIGVIYVRRRGHGPPAA